VKESDTDPATPKAAKRLKNTAHGASCGSEAEIVTSPKGAEDVGPKIESDADDEQGMVRLNQ
jgi:hypothetical protein